MRVTEQLSPTLNPSAVAKTDDAPSHPTRLVRVWAVVIVALTMLNFALAVWYLARTGDATSFLSHQMMTPFLAIIYTRLGLLISAHRPRNPIGWILLIVSSSYMFSALVSGALLYASILSAPVGLTLLDLATWLGNWVWLPAQLLPLTFVFLLFPDGHLPSPRWRVMGSAGGLSLLLLMLALAAHPGPVASWGTQPNPFGIVGAESVLDSLIIVGGLMLAISVFGSMAAIVARFRRSSGIERAQMKWLVYAAILILIVGIFTVPFWISGDQFTPLAMELSIVLTNLTTLGIAVAVTIAIVGYHLYDIDLIFNRTLVYVVMTGVVFLIYALVVGAAGVLLQSQGSWLLALLATGLVAVLFQPIRDRLQRGVNRILYGQRDEPFSVLVQLGQRLEQTMAPNTLYPTIVETVASALRLPYVALEVGQSEDFMTVETYGRPVADPAILPLTNRGEVVGRLLVGPRVGDEIFSEADLQLLQNIARQAGAAVYGAELTADLQRSRQQIVASREEERRRLRRDLHDGLGPSLASLLIESRVLRRLIRDDPAAAERLADEMQSDIRATIEDIRRVVHELRPPALDDLGLVAAVQVMAAKIGYEDGRIAGTGRDLRVAVDAPAELAGLPAAVEVAAFRIIQEALTNVVHHAQARCAVVRLRLEEMLFIEVVDDGVGINGGRAGGLGLHSMRERAAELGGTFTIAPSPQGGTIVMVALPLRGG